MDTTAEAKVSVLCSGGFFRKEGLVAVVITSPVAPAGGGRLGPAVVVILVDLSWSLSPAAPSAFLMDFLK